MERRKVSNLPERSSELPSDYLKMVREVFTTNFDEALRKVSELKGKEVQFDVTGAIYPDEILLVVSLVGSGDISATTVHVSVDFDPKASAPTLEDLLARLVDGAGFCFGEFLDHEKTEKLQMLAESSLSAFENVPFEWTPVKVDKHTVHARVDRTHVGLDQMAEDWLAKNDPDYEAQLEADQTETEELFVTGEKARKKGSLH
jgi:hypothetical protein